MTQVYWNLELEVRPEQAEAFRTLMGEMVANTQANEPNTLNYEWSVNADGTVCHIFERYADSAAVMTHMKGFGRFADRFFAAVKPLRFHVYGAPSDEVKGALAALSPRYFGLAAGFHR